MKGVHPEEMCEYEIVYIHQYGSHLSKTTENEDIKRQTLSTIRSYLNYYQSF